jgi:uncharacterized protein YrrD
MTKRATDVIGRPIVSADTGRKLGIVGDVLLSDSGTEVVGLVVKHGALRGEDVLPASAMHSLGPDAVVSRTDELIDGREWRDRELSRRGDATSAPPAKSVDRERNLNPSD